MHASATKRLRPAGGVRPARGLWTAVRARRMQTLRPRRTGEGSAPPRNERRISEHQAWLIGLTSVVLAGVSLALLALLMP